LTSCLSRGGAGFIHQFKSENFKFHECSPCRYCTLVGVFGFMAFSENGEEVRGNQGLHDQQLGLRWIQENIEKFGGDKSKVFAVNLALKQKFFSNSFVLVFINNRWNIALWINRLPST